MRLMDGIDGEAGAMGKERLAPVVVERNEVIPEITFAFGQRLPPILCAAPRSLWPP